MTKPIDRLTTDLGERLLDAHDRRGFLGRLGATAVAAGAVQLFGAPAADAALRCGQSGCFDTGDVDVCYMPWIANKDAAVRNGPGTGYLQIGTVSKNGHFGRQSSRNPSCASQPAPQPSENNFIWGYVHAGASAGQSGWVSLSDFGGDTAFGSSMCGPAGAGFDCRPDYAAACGGHCTAPDTGSATSVSGSRQIAAREVYLRYAPGSTAYSYVLQGNTVNLKCRVGSYTCVGVVNGPSAGKIGWVISSALA